MANVILLFPSNSGTMIATKALRDSGLQARMMPTPPSAQSASNLCLSIDHAAEAEALEVLKVARVGVSTIIR